MNTVQRRAWTPNCVGQNQFNSLRFCTFEVVDDELVDLMCRANLCCRVNIDLVNHITVINLTNDLLLSVYILLIFDFLRQLDHLLNKFSLWVWFINFNKQFLELSIK